MVPSVACVNKQGRHHSEQTLEGATGVDPYRDVRILSVLYPSDAYFQDTVCVFNLKAQQVGWDGQTPNGCLVAIQSSPLQLTHATSSGLGERKVICVRHSSN